MNIRTLGKTGYAVSEIGLGLWQLGGDFGPVGEETATEILKTARSLDVNFWDTADVYGAGMSESRVGAFKDKKGVFIATKLGRGPQFEGMTRYTKARVKESLAGLQRTVIIYFHKEIEVCDTVICRSVRKYVNKHLLLLTGGKRNVIFYLCAFESYVAHVAYHYVFCLSRCFYPYPQPLHIQPHSRRKAAAH